jgi:hypothetical protein
MFIIVQDHGQYLSMLQWLFVYKYTDQVHSFQHRSPHLQVDLRDIDKDGIFDTNFRKEMNIRAVGASEVGDCSHGKMFANTQCDGGHVEQLLDKSNCNTTNCSVINITNGINDGTGVSQKIFVVPEPASSGGLKNISGHVNLCVVNDVCHFGCRIVCPFVGNGVVVAVVVVHGNKL